MSYHWNITLRRHIRPLRTRRIKHRLDELGAEDKCRSTRAVQAVQADQRQFQERVMIEGVCSIRDGRRIWTCPQREAVREFL